MAQSIELTSGSVFAGSPITFKVTPQTLEITPTFHRVVIEVTCGLTGGNYETVKLTSPVTTEGTEVLFDVSSAIRVPIDSYEYTAEPTSYPLVKWMLNVYDEYMDSAGNVFTKQGEISYPSSGELICIAGSLSDIYRLKSDVFASISQFSNKPTKSPHLSFVGEELVYAQPYDTPVALEGSSVVTQAPTSKLFAVVSEGAQTVGGIPVYALPSSEKNKRQEFRFINTFGVLESISVPRAYSKKVAVTSEAYTISKQETFNKFSRAAIKKTNNNESWLFQTDPLTEDWLQWYLHEFMMAERMWMRINDTWIPCTITPEESTTFLDRTSANMLTASFTATLDIAGSPFS